MVGSGREGKKWAGCWPFFFRNGVDGCSDGRHVLIVIDAYPNYILLWILQVADGKVDEVLPETRCILEQKDTPFCSRLDILYHALSSRPKAL